MASNISRRGFVKSSLLASAALPLGISSQTAPAAQTDPAARETIQQGKIANMEFSRLMLGGNLIGGHSHARDLSYVSPLMRRYNTPAKIRETLEIAESKGITAVNTWVMDDNSALFEHWKAGGKIKWIAQTRLDGAGGFGQIQRAIDEGAVGVHLTGDTAEGLLAQGKFDKVVESVSYIKERKRIAGIGAHDLRVVVEGEKLKVPNDFYIKTFHSHDYFSARRPGDNGVLGANDNSWCQDPQAVIDVFAKVEKPWIAFKILAAGAIQPRAGFPFAFNGGADFILVGMFDWQIDENVKLVRRVLNVAMASDSKRTRPWH